MTMRQLTSSRPGGVPACVSSVASDIVRQPPWAAARSSSGLVFPSGAPIRLGSENGSEENAPDWPVIEPLPRATFPSQTMSAVRSILGTSAPLGDDGRSAVGVIGLRGRACGREDAEQPQFVLARVREA